jgi:hypothetical protein
MPWLEDGPDYRFLPTGELEYRDRWGQYRIAGGCNADDWWLWQAYREEAIQILQETPAQYSLEEVYCSHQRFQYLCRWLLQASGIDPANVAVRQVRRLLFSCRLDGQIVRAPLVSLNEFPAARHPVPGGEPISDKVKLLSVLAAQCSSLAELEEVACSRPLREVLGIASELSWAAKTRDDKESAQMEAAKADFIKNSDAIIARLAQEERRG